MNPDRTIIDYSNLPKDFYGENMLIGANILNVEIHNYLNYIKNEMSHPITNKLYKDIQKVLSESLLDIDDYLHDMPGKPGMPEIPGIPGYTFAPRDDGLTKEGVLTNLYTNLEEIQKLSTHMRDSINDGSLIIISILNDIPVIDPLEPFEDTGYNATQFLENHTDYNPFIIKSNKIFTGNAIDWPAPHATGKEFIECVDDATASHWTRVKPGGRRFIKMFVNGGIPAIVLKPDWWDSNNVPGTKVFNAIEDGFVNKFTSRFLVEEQIPDDDTDFILGADHCNQISRQTVYRLEEVSMHELTVYWLDALWMSELGVYWLDALSKNKRTNGGKRNERKRKTIKKNKTNKTKKSKRPNKKAKSKRANKKAKSKRR